MSFKQVVKNYRKKHVLMGRYQVAGARNPTLHMVIVVHAGGQETRAQSGAGIL